MADLHVNSREVELGAGADVAEVRTGERVRAEQGGLEAVCGLQEHELHGREEGRDLPGRRPLGHGMQGPRPRGGEAEGSGAEEDAASHGRRAEGGANQRKEGELKKAVLRLRVATWLVADDATGHRWVPASGWVYGIFRLAGACGLPDSWPGAIIPSNPGQ